MATEDRRLPDERVKEILAAAEKATPGPWVATPEDDDANLVTHIVRPVKVASNNVEYVDVLPRIEFPNLGDLQPNNEADAAFVANCDPATIAALASELLVLREALRPFSIAAGGLFTRNFNASDVLFLKAATASHAEVRVTAGDFFRARAALSGGTNV